jgi:hypothetical protein
MIVFKEYSKLMEKKKELEKQNEINSIKKINNEITKTSYYLLKDHC